MWTTVGGLQDASSCGLQLVVYRMRLDVDYSWWFTGCVQLWTTVGGLQDASRCGLQLVVYRMRPAVDYSWWFTGCV